MVCFEHTTVGQALFINHSLSLSLSLTLSLSLSLNVACVYNLEKTIDIERITTR